MNDKMRTTFKLPRWLHKAIKRESVNTEEEMTTIIVQQLAARYPEEAALFFGSSTEAILPKSDNQDNIAA